MGKCSKLKRTIGYVIGAIGIGIILTFIIPIWGWVIAVGAGLIYLGWCLIQQYK